VEFHGHFAPFLFILNQMAMCTFTSESKILMAWSLWKLQKIVGVNSNYLLVEIIQIGHQLQIFFGNTPIDDKH
jgi:hypothetical protein